ncbi:MAG: glycogen synthase GlgA [Chromatiaceae bacterium]|nr:glycogen synthase GlgA [Chromatiaceae bacterium]
MAKKPTGSTRKPAARRATAKTDVQGGPKTQGASPKAEVAPATTTPEAISPAAPARPHSRQTLRQTPKTANTAATPAPAPRAKAKMPATEVAQKAAPEASTKQPKPKPKAAATEVPPSAPAARPAEVAGQAATLTSAQPEVEPAAEPEAPAEPLAAVTPDALIEAETLAETDAAQPEDHANPLSPEETPAPVSQLAEPEPEPEPLPEPEPEMQPEPPPPPPAPARPSLFIVHITPELASVAKVGGLADVVFGLSRELAIRGNHVEIILPKYASMRYDQIFEMQEAYKDLWVPWYGGAIHCTVFFGFVHGRKCFFIEPHSQDNFFNRHAIYGFNDDVLRYAFFSRAAMEFLWKSGKHPDIIHCHDWQTALAPVFLYEIYQALGMHHPRVCLTIHNFAHQGVTGPELLNATGLHRPEHFFSETRLRDNRYPRALNMLKGGIVYSNFVTTVSPRYAFETKDQGQGFGLEPTLHTHHIKYGGVVNGIDYDVWNPEIDRHIPVQYGLDTIERKYDNKRALRQRLMLADNEKAIVAFIGRLDPQKGLDLVRHAIFYALERGAQFVLLGSSPNERINADFWGLKRMLNDSPDCHLEIGFDEELSHLIYAGADMMLVPSRFEPCGLTQLIALRYGTIPVVRAVGGLADTVFDKDHAQRPLNERNGYVFNDYDQPGLESALGRAIACYNDYPEHFRDLMKNAMRADYSWNHPGQDYLNIYDYIRNV